MSETELHLENYFIKLNMPIYYFVGDHISKLIH